MCVLGGLSNPAQGSRSDGTIGPGEARAVLIRSGCRIEFTIAPNLGGHIVSSFTLGLTRAGRPVPATVSATFTMNSMPMPSLGLLLKQVRPGIYQGSGEKLTMPGSWQIRIHIAERHALPLDVVLTDIASVE
jgi:hypothetical protein